jgi:hypothetical protein
MIDTMGFEDNRSSQEFDLDSYSSMLSLLKNGVNIVLYVVSLNITRFDKS